MSEAPDNTILAARCPRGWRRDPLTGRPVMPCLGRLLFPCEPHEVPTAREINQQCRAIFGDFTTPCMVRSLICVVEVLLVNAARAKQDRGRCLDLLDDRIVCNAVESALRSQDTVRIRRVAGGW